MPSIKALRAGFKLAMPSFKFQVTTLPDDFSLPSQGSWRGPEGGGGFTLECQIHAKDNLLGCRVVTVIEAT